MADEWVTSDAWFLLAVAMVGDSAPAELGDVIVAGDAINHAVFTYGEIDGATSRLLGAGLLEIVDDRFRLTDSGRDLHQRCPSSNQLDALTWIHVVLTDRYPIRPAPAGCLEERLYHQAVGKYVGRSSKT